MNGGVCISLLSSSVEIAGTENSCASLSSVFLADKATCFIEHMSPAHNAQLFAIHSGDVVIAGDIKNNNGQYCVITFLTSL
jgi:hypothetical protein